MDTSHPRFSIYVIHNSLDKNKKYVGQTSRTISARFSGHRQAAKSGKSNSIIHRAMRKYGAHNFRIEVIFTALSRDDACWAEKKFIEEMGSVVPGGYNISTGGLGPSGYKMSEENKKKRSASMKAIWHDSREKMMEGPRASSRRDWNPESRAEMARIAREQYNKPGAREAHSVRMKAINAGRSAEQERARRDKISVAHKGRKQTPEHRAANAAGQKGKILSAETRQRMSQSQQGHDVSVATRTKISVAHIGRKHTPDHRAANAAAQRGKKVSLETRRKASESMKRHFALFPRDAGSYHRGPHSDETKAKISVAAKKREEKKRLAKILA